MSSYSFEKSYLQSFEEIPCRECDKMLDIADEICKGRDEQWLSVLIKRKMAKDQPIERIQEHCKTLCRIIAASVRTAKRNLGRIP